MLSDEEQIRALVAAWMKATQAGDVDTVLGLMADDAVFLLPGRPPMHKPEFAAQARAQQPGSLQVRITPPGGKPAMERAGHTLTVFHRQQGRWLLARDANLLAPVQP